MARSELQVSSSQDIGPRVIAASQQRVELGSYCRGLIDHQKVNDRTPPADYSDAGSAYKNIVAASIVTDRESVTSNERGRSAPATHERKLDQIIRVATYLNTIRIKYIFHCSVSSFKLEMTRERKQKSRTVAAVAIGPMVQARVRQFIYY